MNTNRLHALQLSLRQFNDYTVQRFCIIILILCSIGCSQQNQSTIKVKNYYRPDSLNDLILANLRTKRIVMLGDADHGNGYYMRLVTVALDRWLDQLEKENKSLTNQGEVQKRDQQLHPLPKKLMLFIETDSEWVSLIYQYMQTGDISSWLTRNIHLGFKWGSILGGVSIDGIEFFRNLKRIEKRVKQLNMQDALHPYDFKIVGPEGVPPCDYKKTKDSTVWKEQFRQAQKGNFEYFVRQRDEISSSTIWKTLDNHSDYKALVFYGTAHLLRGRQNKAKWGGAFIGIDTAYGYYLAHYLDEYFSRDSISIFLTENYPRGSYSGIAEMERSATTPDYYVYCVPIPPAQCPLEIIQCQVTLRVLFGLMKKYSLGSSEEYQVYAHTYTNNLIFQLKRSYLNSRPETRPWLDSLQRCAQDTSRIANKRKVEIADKIIKGFDAIQNINSLHEWIAEPFGKWQFYYSMLKMVLTNLPSKGIPIL